MIVLKQFIDDFKLWAESFGAVENGENCFFRNNTTSDAFMNGGAYFGYVQPDEGPSGAYHDFSLVVFPDKGDGDWVVSLGVGSLGFRNDYDLASQPGIRRRFQRLVSDNGYIKTDFLDIETNLSRDFFDKVPHLKKSLDIYKKVLSVCEIINPHSDEGRIKAKGFLALFADIRGWGTNNARRSIINQSIEKAQGSGKSDNDFIAAIGLLNQRKYLVLQGPPGTGKTRLAKKIAEEKEAIIFFTQFHAETSNTDFVWGIRPKLNSNTLEYEPRDGILVQAIKAAKVNPNRNVVLIIDEINRANLSNVLGPVFYLFEYQMDESNIEIKITDDLKLSKLHDNFYVIATMNTADRSLAVVDFALRRRFAWYTLWPKPIIQLEGHFFKNYFDSIAKIFEQYASDEELNLQPGQGYFIANSEDEMKSRLRYEMLPLIKEYLVEGLLTSGRDEFSAFFRQSIQEELFR